MAINTAPSWQDLYDLGRATLIARNSKLKVNVGDVTDAVIAGTATIGSVLISFSANRFLATFLDGAFGQDLTNLAHDRGVDRDEGDFAVGTLSVGRTSGGAAYTVPAGTRFATDALDSNGTFEIYTSDADVVFTLGDNGPHLVNGTCTKIGSLGNVDQALITRVLDSASLADPTTNVTNPQPFAGGSEEESDEDLRDRVRGFFLTEARGTTAALTYGAKQVAGVKRVNVIPDYITGVVTVYVSDADGNSNDAMAAAVQAELVNNWADAGDAINTVAASLIIESIDVSLTVRTGVDATALVSRVRDAIVARVKRLNPGETLYRDMISSAARDVDRQNILSAIVNSPPANVTPTGSQVLRTDVSHVTFS